MRVRFTLSALTDLEEIFTYIAERDPSAANRIVDRVDLIAASLGDFPMIGHPVDEPDVRVVPLGRFPYLVFYKLAEETVIILHVRHAARLKPWE